MQAENMELENEVSESTTRTRDSQDWLYPELLSEEKLVQILRQRYIRHTDLTQLAKEQLVDLYYKYIIPLPQRTYRNNRRGREMTKRQIVQAKKRKSSLTEVGSPDKKKVKSVGSESRFLTSFNLPSSGSGERIKPPPSCINFEKKKIKLSSSSTSSKAGTVTKLSEEKTKTSIKLKQNGGNSEKIDNSESTKATEHTKSTSSPEKRTIKLINNLSLSTSEADVKKSKVIKDNAQEEKTQDKQEAMDTSSESSSKKTFKMKKVSWP
ncbi:ashwin-like [Saccostrea echinata]|uniref:ashwin-like n=1 Tax=Saccostrea echinata TaxID=191078 RepID=UPI002A840F13|nr:ashwin-like [Saccostrea echinata]